MSGGVVGMRYQLDGLHYVGMAADDMVDALVDEPSGQRALLCIGVALVLIAPVNVGYDDIWLHSAGLADVGLELFTTEAIDDIGWCGGDAIGAVCGAEEGYAEAVLLDEEWVALGAVGCIAVGAHGNESGAIDKGEGTLESAAVAVEAVIVGSSEDVKPYVTQDIEVLVGGS